MLPVSLTFAGALALLNLFLAYRVSKIRHAGKVNIGDGNNPLLLARMRAQANFVEYTPFVLILMVLLERAGGPANLLWWAGAAYVAVRIAHLFGMDPKSPQALRAVGALGTWAILGGLAIWAIWLASHPAAPVPAVHYL